jgi:hypothetical protein
MRRFALILYAFRLNQLRNSVCISCTTHCLLSSWAAHMQLHDRIMYARRATLCGSSGVRVMRCSTLAGPLRHGISLYAQVNKCFTTTLLFVVAVTEDSSETCRPANSDSGLHLYAYFEVHLLVLSNYACMFHSLLMR